IEVWDVSKLAELAQGDELLSARLADFLRTAEIGTLGTSPIPDKLAGLLTQEPASIKPTAGRDLAANLRSCPEGRKGATDFERYCEEALELMFGREFSGRIRQDQVEGGFHRIDLIARLVPQHAFWVALAQDFRVRYVVFEFKNYTEQISQDQVYTTEKYLFPA